MNEEILSRRLPDGGPFYRETDLSQWIAEPWNAASSLVFIAVALFFFLKIRNEMRQHLYLFIAAPVLLAGGIGGTLYHAFRASSFMLFLDVAPIYVLTFGTSAWLWSRILKTWMPVAFITALFLANDSLIFYGLDLKENIKQSLAYANMGIAILLPLIWVNVKEKYFAGGWALAALLAYGAGLSCRVMDAAEPPLLPMGTHFLWHLFCATGTFLLGNYIYRLGKFRPAFPEQTREAKA